MYERKIPEDLDCGIILTMKVLSGKWQPCIIDAIDRGIRRPSELHRSLTTASGRVINMQLESWNNMALFTKRYTTDYPSKLNTTSRPSARVYFPS